MHVESLQSTAQRNKHSQADVHCTSSCTMHQQLLNTDHYDHASSAIF